MNKILVAIFIVMILAIIIATAKNKKLEGFEALNVYETNTTNTTKSSFEKEYEIMSALFRKSPVFIYDEPIIPFLNIIKLQITENLINFIQNHLENIVFIKYKNSPKFKINIAKGIDQIYYKDIDDNNRIMSFEGFFSINNPGSNSNRQYSELFNFSTTKFKAVVKLTTTTKMSVLNPFYTPNLPVKYQLMRIDIKNEVVLDTMVDKYTDSLSPNHFRIQNDLHLLTPFKTSYDTMLINKTAGFKNEKKKID